MTFFAAPVVLAAVAQATEHIRLTSAVSVLSTADPVQVFEDFATVDLISAGRAEITAGRGAYTESFPLFGYDFADEDLERAVAHSVTWAELGDDPRRYLLTGADRAGNLLELVVLDLGGDGLVTHAMGLRRSTARSFSETSDDPEAHVRTYQERRADHRRDDRAVRRGGRARLGAASARRTSPGTWTSTARWGCRVSRVGPAGTRASRRSRSAGTDRGRHGLRAHPPSGPPLPGERVERLEPSVSRDLARSGPISSSAASCSAAPRAAA